MAICAYCKNERELCVSHSIPNSVFKSISRQNSGKLISAPAGDGKIHYSTDSGGAKILCKDCEGYFNKNFDGPFVNAIKKWDRGVSREGFGYRLEYCPNSIAHSLASIFWRASVSSSDFYESAKISPRDRNSLLNLLDGPRATVLKDCSCSVERLYDKQPESSGGIPQEKISQIILPAAAYRISWGESRSHQRFSFTVIMQGFLFALVVPRLPHSKSRKAKYLKSDKIKQHAPRIYFLDYPPLADLAVNMVRKSLAGETSV